MTEFKESYVKYLGKLAGGFPGLGYVEPGKYFHIQSPDQLRVVEEAGSEVFEKTSTKPRKNQIAQFPFSDYILASKEDLQHLRDAEETFAYEPSDEETVPPAEIDTTPSINTPKQAGDT